MTWFLKRFITAAAVMQLGWFCTAYAEDFSGEEIKNIDRIVNTAIKEANGKDVQAAILKSVIAAFPIIMKDTPESIAFIKKLEEQCRKRYPAGSKELELRYKAMAESEYPIYQLGDTIIVVYLLHGKAFTVSGPYYRQDSRFVWVGSKKILKKNLSKLFADRFDPELIKQYRANYVIQNVRRYEQRREKYLDMLKSRNQEKIYELTGVSKYKARRQAAQKLALKKYREALARREEFASAIRIAGENRPAGARRIKRLIQVHAGTPEAENGKKLLADWEEDIARKTEEVQNILAYCSQPSAVPSQLKSKFGIDLFDVQLLSVIETRFRGIPDSKKLLDQLASLQQIIARKIIAEGKEKLKAAQTAEEMLQIFRTVIASCPAHTPELKQVMEIYQNASRKYVTRVIELAEKSNNYSDALAYLKKAIVYCPDAPNINDARNLYSRYLREMEQKRQAQLARQNPMKSCPACQGSGQVTQSGFLPGQAAIGGQITTCSICSGTGAVSRNTDVRLCPVCGGRKSSRSMFTDQAMRCSHCNGCGYVIFTY